MTQQEMMRKLQELGFMLTELNLFLDTHPNNCDAARKQQECQTKADELRREYEEKYGPIGEIAATTSRWAWITDPWPWDVADNGEGDE